MGPVPRRISACYTASMHAPANPAPIDPELLLLAYRSGIFPMAESRDDPDIFWVEPKRRAVFPLDGLHCSRSLARTLRRGKFTVTCNQAFERVIAECAGPRRDSAGIGAGAGEGESWISRRIVASYTLLHRLGHAHSIECWRTGIDGRGELVGGLYGVGFDRVFCGESMFSRASDASKVALAWLVAALRRCNAEVLDCQFMTDHLASLGAVELSQQRYVALLRRAQRTYAAGAGGAEGLGVGWGEGWGEGAVLPLPEGFAALLADAAAAGAASSPGNFIAQSLTQTS